MLKGLESLCDMPMYKKWLSEEEKRASLMLCDFIDFCAPNEAVKSQLKDCLIVLMSCCEERENLCKNNESSSAVRRS